MLSAVDTRWLYLACIFSLAPKVAFAEPQQAVTSSPQAREDSREARFAYGFLAGADVALHETDTFKIRNGYVRRDESPGPLAPANMVLTALLLPVRGTKTSVAPLLPVGLVSERFAGGLGVAATLEVAEHLDFGVGTAVILKKVPVLNTTQREAYRKEDPLPLWASDTIGTQFRPSLVFGFFFVFH
jgi:hypothetical protein